MPTAEQAARFRATAGLFDVIPRPPRAWHDFTDPVRLLAWRDRVAVVVAKRAAAEAAEKEAEIARRVDFFLSFRADASRALHALDEDLDRERGLLNTTWFQPAAVPDGNGAEAPVTTPKGGTSPEHVHRYAERGRARLGPSGRR